MTIRSRINRLTERMEVEGTSRPLTVVLRQASTGDPPARCERTNSAGLPVVEISFDPMAGAVALPPGPFKLVQGVDPVDLV